MPFVRGTRYTTLARGAGGNTAPTITVPGAQSATSNVALAITGISISDPESQSQTVSISVSHGTFSLASTTGLSFSVGDGTADASMTFSGTLANCNTAIATLTYTSTTDYTGSDTLTINSTDSGGGAATQKTVAITVAWNPLSLGSNLAMWMDPSYGTYTDDGVTPAASGDVVKRWYSRNNASLYLEQTTLGNRPSVATGANGKLHIISSSGSRYMTTTNALGVFPTVNATRSLAVCAVANTSAAIAAYPFSLGTYTNNQLWGLDCNTSAIAVRGFANNCITTFSISDGTWFIADATYDGTTMSIRKDAATEQTFTPSAYNTTYGEVDLMRTQNGSGYWTGSVAHLVLTNHKLTSGELALVYAYLNANKPT